MKKLFTLFFSLLIFTGLNAQTVVFEEDFQNGMPSSFILVDNDGNTPASNVSFINDAWIVDQNFDDTTDLVAYSTSWYNPAGQSDDWMITPAIALPAGSISLSWDAKAQDPAFPDGYNVLLSTTGTNLSDFTVTLFSVASENAMWTSRTADLTAYAGQTVHIAFQNNSTDQFILLIDDIEITQAPVSVNEIKTEKPEVTLAPNPTSTVTKIQIGLSRNADVEIQLFDITGKVVKSIASRPMHSGLNSIQLNASDLESGVYFVRVKTDAGEAIRKLTVVK